MAEETKNEEGSQPVTEETPDASAQTNEEPQVTPDPAPQPEADHADPQKEAKKQESTTSEQLVDANGKPIANPASYIKALEEKMARISERAERAERDLKRLSDEDKATIESDVQSIKAELQQALQDAKDEKVKAWKLQAQAQYLLDDETVEEFVTGDTYEAIFAKAKKLASKMAKPAEEPKSKPKPPENTKIGNSSDTPKSTLTVDELAEKSPQEILALMKANRMKEINEVLSGKK